MPEWVCPRQPPRVPVSSSALSLELSTTPQTWIGKDPGSTTPQLPGHSSLASFCLLPTEKTETQKEGKHCPRPYGWVYYHTARKWNTRAGHWPWVQILPVTSQLSALDTLLPISVPQSIKWDN